MVYVVRLDSLHSREEINKKDSNNEKVKVTTKIWYWQILDLSNLDI